LSDKQNVPLVGFLPWRRRYSLTTAYGFPTFIKKLSRSSRIWPNSPR